MFAPTTFYNACRATCDWTSPFSEAEVALMERQFYTVEIFVGDDPRVCSPVDSMSTRLGHVGRVETECELVSIFLRIMSSDNDVELCSAVS